MQRNRRTFLTGLGAGLATAAGGMAWWLSTSQKRTARWARRLAGEARREIEPAPRRPDPAKWADSGITMAWLGHSTVLLNFYGIRILTDPVLGSHVGVSLGFTTLGPKRYVAPALAWAELPPVDILLLSHAHMDHLDVPTLRQFEPGTFTVSAKSTRDILAATRLNQVTELGWNQKVTYRNATGELEVTAVEVKHWGERWPSDRPRGYNGYILRREGKSLLFGGDTALTPALGQLKARGPFEAAIMPIGAYRPWIWNHCTPEQAVDMADAAEAKYIVPVHHQTFRLSDEPRNEPIERLETCLAREPERLALRRIGETFECPLG